MIESFHGQREGEGHPTKLTLRQIRFVVLLSQVLHFGRASRELGVAPSAFSRQIQDAEDLLGFKLFNRTKRSVALTQAGEQYIGEAKVALAALERAFETAQLAGAGKLGRVRVGYLASVFFTGVMQEIVSTFRDKNPQVDFNFVEVGACGILQELLGGLIDVAFVIAPVNHAHTIQVGTVFEDQLLVAVPENSEFARLPVVDPTQLRRARFALPREDFGLFDVSRRGEFYPIIGSKCATLEEALTKVALSGRVVVMPRLLSKHLSFPGVTYRTLTGKPVIKQTLVAYRRDERSAVVEEFVKMALTRIETGCKD